MKTKIILLTLALGASTCLLTAQDGNNRPKDSVHRRVKARWATNLA